MKQNKSLRVAIIVITLLLSAVFPVLAQAIPPADSAPPSVPEAVLLLIPILLGRIGIPLISWLKAQFAWTQPEDKPKNAWLAFGVSLILAVFSLAITNSFVPILDPSSVVTWISLAFTVATLIYKSMPSDPTGTGS